MRRPPLLHAALVAAALLVSGCGDGGEDAGGALAAGASSSSLVTTTAPEPAGAGFCGQLAALGGEVEESFLGTAEHLAVIDGLVAAAPDQVRPDLVRFRDHVREFVSPDVPGSADMERFPDDVQAALARISAYQAEQC